MKRMNNWLAQIRTRSRRKHILHCTHAKIIVHVSPVAGWQQAVSSTTWPHLQFTPAMARYICSIKFFHLKMTLGLAFANCPLRRWVWQSASWRQRWFVLSSSFIWKWPLGWPSANLGCCLRNHEQTLMCTKACFRGKAFALFYIEFTKPRSRLHYSTLQP